MVEITQTITTLEIADMLNMRHGNILRKLEGWELKEKHIKGIVILLRLSLISLKKCGPAPTVLRKMSSTKS